MPKNRSKKHGKGGSRGLVFSAEDVELRNAVATKKEKARHERRLLAGAVSSDESDEMSDFDEGKLHAAEAPVKKPNKLSGTAAILGEEFGGGNLNRGAKATSTMKLVKMKDMNARIAGDGAPRGDPSSGLTRREREELEASRAAAKVAADIKAGRHASAKSDLERLKEVRARRAREAATRKEDDEARKLEEMRRKMEDEGKTSSRSKKKRHSDSDSSDSSDSDTESDSDAPEIVIYTTRELKKLKPPQLKEALKAHGLSTQGNKKTLLKRLTEAQKALGH